MHVKICGLTHPSHTEAAMSAGADFIGLVFAERSRRHVSVEQAKRIIAPLHRAGAEQPSSAILDGDGPWFERSARALERRLEQQRPLLVGVFADQPAALVNSIAEAVGLDLVQLSGTERWESCLQIKWPVIKTVRTEPGVSAHTLRLTIEPGMAHLVHLDAFVAGELGGTGTVAAWEVAQELAAELPMMLAGGLNLANVAEAVRTVRPWAVDVSSGVERDGRKDPALIEAFLAAVRGIGDEDGEAWRLTDRQHAR